MTAYRVTFLIRVSPTCSPESEKTGHSTNSIGRHLLSLAKEGHVCAKEKNEAGRLLSAFTLRLGIDHLHSEVRDHAVDCA